MGKNKKTKKIHDESNLNEEIQNESINSEDSNKNTDVLNEENKNVIYIKEKEKRTSYASAVLLLCGWMFIVILSVVFIIFAITDFKNSIDDFQDKSSISNFFSVLGLSFHVLLYVLVIVISGVKSLKYYVSIKHYHSTEKKELEKALIEIDRKIQNNEKLTKKEESLQKKDQKRKDKEEKARQKDIEKKQKVIDEIQKDIDETNKN